jgi:transposase InsO family protein
VIVDVETRPQIGRPWVTLVIDVASRIIAGLHLSLEEPSVISVGMALRHAILDKADALRERDVAADWPAFGLSDSVQSDNGSDFRSATFQRACANLGIETEYRPMGVLLYGGHIERLIGTAQQEMHLLPGTTFFNVAECQRRSKTRPVWRSKIRPPPVRLSITHKFDEPGPVLLLWLNRLWFRPRLRITGGAVSLRIERD